MLLWFSGDHGRCLGKAVSSSLSQMVRGKIKGVSHRDAEGKERKNKGDPPCPIFGR
jgi:hypothetical protein